MRILFDQGTPVPLRRYLRPHEVDTAAERQWSALQNGQLLEAAEENGYDLLVTTDKSIKYQQNLKNRQISILVLSKASWPRIRLKIEQIRKACLDLSKGECVEIEI